MFHHLALLAEEPHFACAGSSALLLPLLPLLLTFNLELVFIFVLTAFMLFVLLLALDAGGVDV